MADKFCNTCGAIGYAELIVTCFKCKVNHEHYYCMRNNAYYCPDSWLCEQCAMDEGKIPDKPRMHKDTGKVKFLPAEEVIKLSSGVTNGPLKSNMASAPSRTYLSRKNPAGSMPRPLFQASKRFQERSSALIPAKECGAKKQLSAASVPSLAVQTSKKAKIPVKFSETPSSSSVPRHSLSDRLTGKKALLTSVKLHDMQKQSKDALISSKELEDFTEAENAVKNSACRTSSSRRLQMDVTESPKRSETTNVDVKLKKVKIKNKASSVSSLPMHPLQKMDSGGRNYASVKSQNCHDEERVVQNAVAKINTYRHYLPALHVSWRGGFRMGDTAEQFYGGFLAKPPCEVDRRSYELLRQMPSVLQVKLLNRFDIWDDLFHNDCPDLGDIGLYFFPSANIERSRKNNSCLFELMEKENLMIKSLVDGAELLIFTSKQLDVDSQYFISRSSPECLLVGVFRECINNLSFNIVGECTGASPPFDCSVSPLETGKTPTSLVLDSTIQQLLLEFGPQKPNELDVKTSIVPPENNVKSEPEEATPISAIGSYPFFLLNAKAESLPGAKMKGFEGQKCLETEESKRAVSTFSLESSQNGDGIMERTASRRVADKYLKIFNSGIKKESH